MTLVIDWGSGKKLLAVACGDGKAEAHSDWETLHSFGILASFIVVLKSWAARDIGMVFRMYPGL